MKKERREKEREGRRNKRRKGERMEREGYREMILFVFSK